MLSRLKNFAAWLPYYWHQRNTPPRGTALKAVRALENFPKDKHIVDLGAGHGVDTNIFLEAGWTVIAVDKSAPGLWLCARRARKAGLANRLSCIQSDIERYALTPCAGVNASFALPFCDKEKWPETWEGIRSAILPEGIFAGQFFGLKDDWNQNPLKNEPTLHFTQKAVLRLFEGFDILDFKEVNQDGHGPCGEKKHWQVYHVVARKSA